MDPYYNDYFITTTDIWEFEKQNYMDGQWSDENAEIFIAKIRQLITRIGVPYYRESDIHDEKGRIYFESNMMKYQLGFESTQNKFDHDLWFVKDRFYDYNGCEEITSENSGSEFDYWFALKLGQYKGKLVELDDFLNFQIERNFKLDLTRFKRFLSLVIRQYKNDIFNEELIRSITEWIKIGETENGGRKSSTELTDTRVSLPYSMQLVGLYKDHPDNGAKLKRLTELYNMLLSCNMLQENTDFTSFKRLFVRQKISPNKKVNWTGTFQELNLFVKHLSHSGKVIKLNKDIWNFTIGCFLKDNLPIKKHQVADANSSKEKFNDHILGLILAL